MFRALNTTCLLCESVVMCNKREERANVLWLLCAGGLRSLGAESGGML